MEQLVQDWARPGEDLPVPPHHIPTLGNMSFQVTPHDSPHLGPVEFSGLLGTGPGGMEA